MLDTTAMSAPLKIAGKPQTWMKSTTWPWPNDGSRNSRSVRLPSAPPRTSPNIVAQASDRMRGAKTTMNPTTATATIERIQVKPLASENAAPEFVT